MKGENCPPPPKEKCLHMYGTAPGGGKGLMLLFITLKVLNSKRGIKKKRGGEGGGVIITRRGMVFPPAPHAKHD